MPGRARELSVSAAALWILAVIAALFFMRSAQTLLIPVAVAVLISYALEPVVAWLERHRVPRLVGAGVALVVVLGMCGVGAYALRDDVMQLVETLPTALQRARNFVLLQFGPGTEAIEEATKGLGAPSAKVSGALLQRGLSSVFSFAGHLVVTFFLIYFLLISSHRVRNRLVEIYGSDAERRRLTATIIDDINAQIRRYLVVLLVTATIVGVATWLVLVWMGVQHAAMWGILAGIFNSIPYFGPVIVSGGLLVVGLVQNNSAIQALQMSGAAILITSLEGWLLTPSLMGKAERMNALVVFLGLLSWTWVWGGWGTILAVPILVIIKSVADHLEGLKPVGRLMAP